MWEENRGVNRKKWRQGWVEGDWMNESWRRSCWPPPACTSDGCSSEKACLPLLFPLWFQVLPPLSDQTNTEINTQTLRLKKKRLYHPDPFADKQLNAVNVASQGNLNTAIRVQGQIYELKFITQRILQNSMPNKSTDNSSHSHDVLPTLSLFPNLYSAVKKKNFWITTKTTQTCLYPLTSNPSRHAAHPPGRHAELLTTQHSAGALSVWIKNKSEKFKTKVSETRKSVK